MLVDGDVFDFLDAGRAGGGGGRHLQEGGGQQGDDPASEGFGGDHSGGRFCRGD